MFKYQTAVERKNEKILRRQVKILEKNVKYTELKDRLETMKKKMEDLYLGESEKSSIIFKYDSMEKRKEAKRNRRLHKQMKIQCEEIERELEHIKNNVIYGNDNNSYDEKVEEEIKGEHKEIIDTNYEEEETTSITDIISHDISALCSIHKDSYYFDEITYNCISDYFDLIRYSSLNMLTPKSVEECLIVAIEQSSFRIHSVNKEYFSIILREKVIISNYGIKKGRWINIVYNLKKEKINLRTIKQFKNAIIKRHMIQSSALKRIEKKMDVQERMFLEKMVELEESKKADIAAAEVRKCDKLVKDEVSQMGKRWNNVLKDNRFMDQRKKKKLGLVKLGKLENNTRVSQFLKLLLTLSMANTAEANMISENSSLPFFILLMGLISFVSRGLHITASYVSLVFYLIMVNDGSYFSYLFMSGVIISVLIATFLIDFKIKNDINMPLDFVRLASYKETLSYWGSSYVKTLNTPQFAIALCTSFLLSGYSSNLSILALIMTIFSGNLRHFLEDDSYYSGSLISHATGSHSSCCWSSARAFSQLAVLTSKNQIYLNDSSYFCHFRSDVINILRRYYDTGSLVLVSAVEIDLGLDLTSFQREILQIILEMGGPVNDLQYFKRYLNKIRMHGLVKMALNLVFSLEKLFSTRVDVLTSLLQKILSVYNINGYVCYTGFKNYPGEEEEYLEVCERMLWERIDGLSSFPKDSIYKSEMIKEIEKESIDSISSHLLKMRSGLARLSSDSHNSIVESV